MRRLLLWLLGTSVAEVTLLRDELDIKATEIKRERGEWEACDLMRKARSLLERIANI